MFHKVSALRTGLLSAALLASAAIATPAAAEGEVNIYSYRQPFLIEPLLEAFTKETGIKTNVIFAADGLAERIQAEGENSPADVLLTVDIGRLDGAKEAGITQPVTSEVVNENVPAAFRDPEGHWIGLTTRARIVYASKERVEQDSITYEELADPKWKGKICTRSGQHVYNVALFASIVANKGAEEAEKWLADVRDNLARKPTGNDRSQVQAIFAGECDISLGNTYYMGAMLNNEKEPEQKDWANSVKILFPNTGDRGTHVNISGVVMAKHAPNPEAAVKLIEFLSSEEAQHIYAEANNEYPVKPGVEISELVASWGEFKPDTLSLDEIAKNRKTASELVDKVGFNDGPQS
ncbi:MULTISPECIES: Fe(3+) ABC transporter substrate-binding protein [Stappia]|uniref:Iron(III) transport system substrate-binding protein n=1 Tax=Stappia indica TaxID=538381 RepID=A0A285T9J6_9HYPH|nr:MULTISPECIES: Fe(3+) ABC transporter substrate-binding protein [Stappia]MBC2858110.1 Fe(3+) ABC transporter substrate-binding protein [Stappia sp. 28M-7]SOC18104.1 iron(III) transport system substrate-binding protein [Stappia indica]